MGDAARHHAEALELLAVQQLPLHHEAFLLGLLARGDIAGNGFDGDRIEAMAGETSADFEGHGVAVMGHQA